MAEARERPGAEVDFPSLLMHSVSSNGSADPAAGRPAIFCQVEADPAWSFKLGECSESGSTAASAASAADEPGPDPDVGMPEVVTMLLIPVPGAAVLSSLGTRSAFVPLDEEDAGSSAAGGGPTSMREKAQPSVLSRPGERQGRRWCVNGDGPALARPVAERPFPVRAPSQAPMARQPA